jgi:hypothetical protein
MSEQQQVDGERWTVQSLNILRKLGWEKIGSRNFDIPCVRQIAHATGKSEKRKNDHGVDLLLKYFDPFWEQDKFIIVECKHRAWSGINTSSINEFLKQMINTIDCAGLSEKMSELGCTNINTGLLMIWCHEQDKYDPQKFKEYLKGVDVPKRRNPVSLFVASNDEILKWCSLIAKVESIKSNPETAEFKFFYPSDYFGKRSTSSDRREYVNLTQLFSSYIFAKSKHVEQYRPPEDVHHIFFYATPNKQELNFMFQLVQGFQFEDAQKIKIHFYGEQTQWREHIEDFIEKKNQMYKKNGARKQLEYDFMTKLSEVPADYAREG